MEREEARDVTAASPAKRGTADMFHEVNKKYPMFCRLFFNKIGFFVG